MAKTLDDLMNIPGVVAAGEFKPTGEMIAYKGNLSKEVAGMAAQFCATVTMLFNTLGGSFTQLSGMKWTPQLGWAFSGGDYTVVIMGNWGVFVETKKADFKTSLQGTRRKSGSAIAIAHRSNF